MRNNASPYHRRIAARLAKSREARGKHQANRYTEIDRFMLSYEQAYATYYGIRITISYAHGWYYINQHRYRHSAVAELTNILLAKLHEVEQPTPLEEIDR